MAVIEIDVQDFLPLGQSDRHRPTAHNVFQALPLSQKARPHLNVQFVTQTYSPVQAVTLRRSIFNIGLTDYFIMYQRGAKSHVESIIDIFFMWQNARTVRYNVVTHKLNLVQTVFVSRSKGTKSTLKITQSATYKANRTRTLTQTFSMASKATGYMHILDRYSINLPTLTGPNAPEC
jgi:hypothetical protein